jgi:hypothetical protein
MRCRSPFIQPRPVTLHSPSLHSRPSLRRLSLAPFTVPHFTLHSAALHPSLCHPSLPTLTVPVTPAPHCAGLHSPFRSLSPFTSLPYAHAVFSATLYSRLHYAALHSVPCTPALHCRPSLRHPSLLILPLFTVQSATLHRPPPHSLLTPRYPGRLP